MLKGFIPLQVFFFRDTDRITLHVEMLGYSLLRFEQDFFTRPEFHADLGLFPLTDATLTPTPFIMDAREVAVRFASL